MNPRTILIIIVLAAFVVRGALWLVASQGGPERFIRNDTTRYDLVARALLMTGDWAIAPDHPDLPETVITPGYPAFIALCYRLTQNNQSLAALAQMLVSLLSIVLTFKIGQMSDIPLVAIGGSLLLAFDFLTVTYSLLLLTETLFTVFLLAMLLAGIYWIKKPRRALFAFGMGLFLSLTVLIRPVNYYLVICLLLFVVFWGARNQLGWKSIALQLACFVLPCILLVGGWQLRNYLRTGSAMYSPVQGINMLFYRGAAVVAQRDGISMDQAYRQLGLDGISPWWEVGLHPELHLGEKWNAEGMEIIKANPAIYALVAAKGAVIIFVGTGDQQMLELLGISTGNDASPFGDLKRLSLAAYVQKWFFDHPVEFLLFSVLPLIYQLLTYTGVAIWLLLAVRKHKISAIDSFLWLTIIYLLIASAGPEAYYRFRVPLVPVLVLYAVNGWYLFFQLPYGKTRLSKHAA